MLKLIFTIHIEYDLIMRLITFKIADFQVYSLVLPGFRSFFKRLELMLKVFIITIIRDLIEIFGFWLLKEHSWNLASSLLNIIPFDACKELVRFNLID